MADRAGAVDPEGDAVGLRGPRGRIVGQSFLSLADQGVSSVTNMLAAVAAASALTGQEFGAFSIAYVIFMIVIAAAQSVFGSELVLTTGTEDERRERGREAAAFCVVLGLGAGVALILCGVALPAVRWPLIALGLSLPLLFLQDLLRFVCSLLHKMELALLSDIVWLVIEVAAILAVRSSDVQASATIYTICWLAPGALAGLCILPFFWRGGVPSMARFRTRHYLGYRFIWEFLALRATSQGLTLVLGALAGLAATGAVRGASTLFGPLTVALLAAGSFGAPLVRHTRPSRRDPVVVGLAAVLVIAALLFTAIFLLMPVSVGEHILGATWEESRTMLWAIGVQSAFTAASTAVYLALRLIMPRSTLGLRVASMAVLVPAFFIGYAWWGVTGAVWGLTVGAGVQAVLGCAAYSRLKAAGMGLAHLDEPELARHVASGRHGVERTEEDPA